MTKTVAKSTVLTKNVVAAKSFEQEQDGALNWLVDGVSDAESLDGILCFNKQRSSPSCLDSIDIIMK